MDQDGDPEAPGILLGPAEVFSSNDLLPGPVSPPFSGLLFNLACSYHFPPTGVCPEAEPSGRQEGKERTWVGSIEELRGSSPACVGIMTQPFSGCVTVASDLITLCLSFPIYKMRMDRRAGLMGL